MALNLNGGLILNTGSVSQTAESTRAYAMWSSSLAFEVNAEKIYIGGNQFSFTSSIVTLDAADSTYDRIDVIVADASSSIDGTPRLTKITGTPSSNPEYPVFDTQIQTPLKYVKVKANATTPTIAGSSGDDILDQDADYQTITIYKENAGLSDEWTTTESRYSNISGNDIDSVEESYEGSKSIKTALFPIEWNNSPYATKSHFHHFFTYPQTSGNEYKWKQFAGLTFYSKLTHDVRNYDVRFYVNIYLYEFGNTSSSRRPKRLNINSNESQFWKFIQRDNTTDWQRVVIDRNIIANTYGKDVDEWVIEKIELGAITVKTSHATSDKYIYFDKVEMHLGSIPAEDIDSGDDTSDGTGGTGTIGGSSPYKYDRPLAIVPSKGTFCATNYYSSIGGGNNNTITGSLYSYIGAGQNNIIESGSDYISILGGAYNTASADYSSILGGYLNKNRGSFSSIGGGKSNCICENSENSVIGGGRNHTISGDNDSNTIGGGALNGIETTVSRDFNTISGGQTNCISSNVENATIGGGASNCICRTDGSDFGSTIAGGAVNFISGSHASTIGGGCCNYINGANLATIAGGYLNTASADYSSIIGGKTNCVTGNYSSAGGSGSIASGDYSFAFGGPETNPAGTLGTTSAVGSYSVALGFATCASGSDAFAMGHYNVAAGHGVQALGYKAYAGIAGQNPDLHRGNTAIGCCVFASGSSSTVFGSQNYTIGNCSAVLGGHKNCVAGTLSSIAGGSENTGSGNCGFIGGGICNYTQNQYQVIGGGCQNNAQAGYDVIAGGADNRVSGPYSFIGGGANNKFFGTSPSSSILGGVNNEACHCNAHIIGSELTSDKDDYTFMNNLDVAGIVSGSTFSGSFVGDGSGLTNIGGGSSITLQDNGSSCTTALSLLNIVGATVTEPTADEITVTIGSGLYEAGTGACSIQPTIGSNTVAANSSSIAGGELNSISCVDSDSSHNFIGGGKCNLISGSFAGVIVGGGFNTLTTGSQNSVNIYDFIGGGNNNTAGGGFSSVVGGQNNEATGCASGVFGGAGNKALSCRSSILGGQNNTVNGSGNSSVLGGNCNCIVTSYTGDGFGEFILGGYLNLVSGSDAKCSTIIGGRGNTITHRNSHIIGGTGFISQAERTTYVENLHVTSSVDIPETVSSILTLNRRETTPTSPVEGMIMSSGSAGSSKLYYYDGSSWNALF